MRADKKDQFILQVGIRFLEAAREKAVAFVVIGLSEPVEREILYRIVFIQIDMRDIENVAVLTVVEENDSDLSALFV